MPMSNIYQYLGHENKVKASAGRQPKNGVRLTYMITSAYTTSAAGPARIRRAMRVSDSAAGGCRGEESRKNREFIGSSFAALIRPHAVIVAEIGVVHQDVFTAQASFLAAAGILCNQNHPASFSCVAIKGHGSVTSRVSGQSLD